MKELLSSISSIQLFIIFVMPGFISMQVYRLLMPARQLDWANAAISGLFYSSVNYAFCLPFLSLLAFSFTSESHPYLYAAVGFFILLVAPIIWPCLFARFLRSKKLMKNLQIPFPSAWDYYFDKRMPCFVLIHLKNGRMIGGYYGVNSFATSFPSDGDIYFETVYAVDEKGKFGQPIANSTGALIRRDDYSYIEIFGIPTQEGVNNGQTSRKAGS